MTFRVGMKVVCVDGDTVFFGNRLAGWNGDPPITGKIYTVHAIEFCERYQQPVLRLVEIRNELGYWVNRFRPIVERKTDISIFTKMLTPSDEKIGADK